MGRRDRAERKANVKPAGRDIAPVPAEDYLGRPHDFSQSATLQGAEQLDLTGQVGILYSPDSWSAALRFLTSPSQSRNP